jgi:hypothetical protein
MLDARHKKTADIATGGSVVFPPQENSRINSKLLLAAGTS